ncbi:MAG TPA: cbb3-type cytochrome c oxidase subunit II [Burkholderiaceae bacterium]|nr:cbb3-type cytochrome c oxidase subunit II [Burkholderiaceae bacterium]
MAFREYKIGARMFGISLASSMFITLVMPTIDIRQTGATSIALDKQLAAGRETGFNVDDPFMLGKNKPLKVLVHSDPKTNAPLDPARYVYVYKPGTSFPSGILHPVTLGDSARRLSEAEGHIGEANKTTGAVFGISHGTLMGAEYPFIENLTATKGWTPNDVLAAAKDEDIWHVGAGKSMFVREGCWWCHTLLPEETQDWQVFGAPPSLGDFNGESPTAFGSDRKAPDLLHVGSRNSSREWMTLHFFNPRLVQTHSIMPRFDYMWGDVDANGKKIDYDKWRAEYLDYHEGRRVLPPDVPQYAKDSEIRYLIDFILSLK